MPFLLFYVTHPDEDSARHLADHLLEQKLVACANIFPMESAYRWNDAVQHEREWVSILKTRTSLEAQVEKTIQSFHSYETPCILRYEVRANAAYENWISESTTAP
ncbi:MAG: divalent-cation tolerance protein CutA [Saprospiraceae bacterium]|nr:divalent-cation tolerance protein CutA [Saprospiraceae bacterium]